MIARAGFFIALISASLHVPVWGIGGLLLLYAACAQFDEWILKRARHKAESELSNEIFGWEPDPKNPDNRAVAGGRLCH